ncbi:MAG: hypothetical protein SV201_14885, partial [Pseudomonadota bacterium]|nr:hypothetical protein [Pseudomonadota bacterium]
QQFQRLLAVEGLGLVQRFLIVLHGFVQPLKLLQQEFEQAKDAMPKGGQVDGSDPHAAKPKGEKPEDQKDYTSPLDNPALKAA